MTSHESYMNRRCGSIQKKWARLDTPKSHDEKLPTQSSNPAGGSGFRFPFWGYLQGKHRKLSSGYTVDSCRPLFSHLSQVSLSRPAIYWIRSKEEPKNEYKMTILKVSDTSKMLVCWVKRNISKRRAHDPEPVSYYSTNRSKSMSALSQKKQMATTRMQAPTAVSAREFI